MDGPVYASYTEAYAASKADGSGHGYAGSRASTEQYRAGNRESQLRASVNKLPVGSSLVRWAPYHVAGTLLPALAPLHFHQAVNQGPTSRKHTYHYILASHCTQPAKTVSVVHRPYKPSVKNSENLDVQHERDSQAFEKRAGMYRRLASQPYHHNKVGALQSTGTAWMHFQGVSMHEDVHAACTFDVGHHARMCNHL